MTDFIRTFLETLANNIEKTHEHKDRQTKNIQASELKTATFVPFVDYTSDLEIYDIWDEVHYEDRKDQCDCKDNVHCCERRVRYDEEKEVMNMRDLPDEVFIDDIDTESSAMQVKVLRQRRNGACGYYALQNAVYMLLLSLDSPFRSGIVLFV